MLISHCEYFILFNSTVSAVTVSCEYSVCFAFMAVTLLCCGSSCSEMFWLLLTRPMTFRLTCLCVSGWSYFLLQCEFICLLSTQWHKMWNLLEPGQPLLIQPLGSFISCFSESSAPGCLNRGIPATTQVDSKEPLLHAAMTVNTHRTASE